MRVLVRYLAQLRQAVGSPSETVDLDGPCSLPQLLQLLADRHGPRFRQMLLTADGTLQPGMLLFVGEEQVRGETPVELHDGDEVTILSPMAGG